MKMTSIYIYMYYYLNHSEPIDRWSSSTGPSNVAHLSQDVWRPLNVIFRNIPPLNVTWDPMQHPIHVGGAPHSRVVPLSQLGPYQPHSCSLKKNTCGAPSASSEGMTGPSKLTPNTFETKVLGALGKVLSGNQDIPDIPSRQDFMRLKSKRAAVPKSQMPARGAGNFQKNMQTVIEMCF